VLFAFGRPDRRPTIAAIRTALTNSGLPVTDVRPAKVDARGSTPYFATLDDDAGLFVKVLGEDERAADLLFRMYRFVRLEDVDYRPFSSLRRSVAHVALASLFARDAGVRTPRMQAVVRVGERLDAPRPRSGRRRANGPMVRAERSGPGTSWSVATTGRTAGTRSVTDHHRRVRPDITRRARLENCLQD
jgi:hypothetical protein